MSIWGSLIGGFVGFSFAGPIGALIGSMVGGRISSGRRSGFQRSFAPPQQVFAIALIILTAKLAKADGQVTRDEVEAFKQIFKVPPEDMKDVARVFNQARKDVAGYEAYASQIANLFEPAMQTLEDLLHGLFHIAKADQVIHPAELDYLKKVAEIFGFNEASFSRIRAYHLGPDLADPYTILGIEPNASEEEIKRTWRALIQENHPDRAMARGLPQEFVDLATEKLATINDAYDRISRQRSFG